MVLDGIHMTVAIDCIIEGEAKGADTHARKWAEAQDVAVEPYPAEWELYGKAAGHIRNKQMLVDGQPDLVLAFSHELSASRGTTNMVTQSREAGG